MQNANYELIKVLTLTIFHATYVITIFKLLLQRYFTEAFFTILLFLTIIVVEIEYL